MAADMDNPSALVQAGYTVQHLFTQYIQIPLKGFLRQFFSGFKIMLHFAEYPWAADAATSYHDSVYSLPLKTLLGTGSRSYVAISYDRYMHTRVVLYFPYQGPVRFARIHLCPGTSVNGQCRNTAIL